MNKELKKHLTIIVIDIILGFVFFDFFVSFYWVMWMPLIATNIILSFQILAFGHIKYKWEVLAFFLIPFASIIYIFVDGLPGAIVAIKDLIKKLK